MKTLTTWLTEPPLGKSAVIIWIGATILVFTVWFFVPIFLGVEVRMEYLSISPAFQNLAAIVSTSFGEEFAFRVFPILVVFRFFPKNTMLALLLGMMFSFLFGVWHEWILTGASIVQPCLGLGGFILTIVFLKFGGASSRPFEGLLACGSIHSVCNLMAAVLAHVALEMRV